MVIFFTFDGGEQFLKLPNYYNYLSCALFTLSCPAKPAAQHGTAQHSPSARNTWLSGRHSRPKSRTCRSNTQDGSKFNSGLLLLLLFEFLHEWTLFLSFFYFNSCSCLKNAETYKLGVANKHGKCCLTHNSAIVVLLPKWDQGCDFLNTQKANWPYKV